MFRRVAANGPETAYMQVKSGRSESICAGSYDDIVNEGSWVYLFSTATTPYTADGDISHPRTVRLSVETVAAFLCQSFELLPWSCQLKLATWLAATEHGESST